MSQTNILCIEDNETDYRVLEKTLSLLPSEFLCQVDWAKDYDEGLSAIMDNRHDLYFVDYRLKDKNGIDLIRQAQERGYDGPFVLITGMDDLDLARESLEQGVYNYILKKDLSPSLLYRTISYALERKHVEAALKAEQEFSSFIVSEIPYLVVSVNRQGLISNVNPAMSTLMGGGVDRLLETPWKNILAPEDREDITYKIADDGHIGFEADLINHAGKQRHIHWNVLNKKMGKHDTARLSFVLSGKDMTSQMEEEASQRERQKTEALGHLAGGVAHEINNLLQPILFSADVIQSRLPGDEKLVEACRKIMRNTQSASKIVDDILTYARKDSTNNKELPFVQTFESILEFLEDMIPETTVVDAAGLALSEDRLVCINTTDALRVVKNLVMNASNAMDDQGTVTLSCAMHHQSSFNHALGFEPGDYVCLSIEDHGSGIPKDVVERIYDPFFTTKEIGQGTGLGLSIVYNIVKNWKGGIDVKSAEGQGTTFLVYIPALRKA